jgi:hypothetical protein
MGAAARSRGTMAEGVGLTPTCSNSLIIKGVLSASKELTYTHNLQISATKPTSGN